MAVVALGRGRFGSLRPVAARDLPLPLGGMMAVFKHSPQLKSLIGSTKGFFLFGPKPNTIVIFGGFGDSGGFRRCPCRLTLRLLAERPRLPALTSWYRSLRVTVSGSGTYPGLPGGATRNLPFPFPFFALPGASCAELLLSEVFQSQAQLPHRVKP